VPPEINRQDEHGPFDLIGDVHGCREELVALLGLLGYAERADAAWVHPQGRKLVFLGDLVDRGPDSPGVVRLVMASVQAGSALAVPGNHDDKFARKVAGRDVKVRHGLERTLAQYALAETREPGVTRAAAEFLRGLASHCVLDDGNLVVAHAGLKESMHGGASGEVRAFCLYGETTGETDEFGLPVRVPWARDYRGRARVVYGHTPVPEPEWLNGTINLDTGCVFGGRLTALRYPELELLSVPARAVHAEPARPFRPADSG
jgi:diadenosine tetraphosphatase ApaH/serine/threonine PP2A family protein phosphatase